MEAKFKKRKCRLTKRRDSFVSNSSDLSLKLVLGSTNDLLPIHFILEGAKVQMAVVKLTMIGLINNKDEIWNGTGFMISDDLLMTNYHNIPDQSYKVSNKNITINKVNECFAEFNFQTDWLGQKHNVTRKKCDLNYYIGDKHLDYAIIKVFDKPGKKFGTIPLDYTTQTFKNKPVIIIQHPHGKEKQIALENNFVKKISESIIEYTTDTSIGSSGSPVFTQAWDLIAIHHAWNNISQNNEGILSKIILEDLATKYESMPSNMKNFVRDVLSNSNLPHKLFKNIPLDQVLSHRFFDYEGLKIKRTNGFPIVSKSSYFLDLACCDIKNQIHKKNKISVNAIMNMSAFINKLGVDIFCFFSINEQILELIQRTLRINYNKNFSYFIGQSCKNQYLGMLFNSDKIKVDLKSLNYGLKLSKDLFIQQPFYLNISSTNTQERNVNVDLLMTYIDEKNNDYLKKSQIIDMFINKIMKNSSNDFISITNGVYGIRNYEFINHNKIIIIKKQIDKNIGELYLTYRSKNENLTNFVITKKENVYVKGNDVLITKTNKAIPKFLENLSSVIRYIEPLVVRLVYSSNH